MPAHDPDALASAALRHVRDAEHLLADGDHQSIDQAAHLAGFGPECIRKAALSQRWGDKLLGHAFDADGEDILDTLIALDPHAVRAGVADFPRRFPALAAWHIDRRYDRTGTADPTDTTTLVAEARAAVVATLTTLWLDGRLDGGAP